jgi:hypothetical protein
MDYIIDNYIPYGICNYVYQELLQGSKNSREYELLKEYLNTLPFYELRYGKQSFENAALMFINCKKKRNNSKEYIRFNNSGNSDGK